MAQKEFILQGFTARTHTAAARELFEIDDIESALISVAFVSQSGVVKLQKQLQKVNANALVLAGIRNDITSYQGLNALKKLDVDLYVVDTGSRTVLFHPKIFLVRNATEARVLIGSANLTLGGLNNNIEAGMLMRFDLTIPDEKKFVDSIQSSLIGLPKEYPEHVVKVKTIEMLDDLLASGRIVDELFIPQPRASKSTGDDGKKDTTPRIKLKVPAERPALAKAKKAPEKKKVAEEAPPPSTGIEAELVWESKPLAERDLSIPSGTNTHPTGSINLDKGLLPDTVDFRHYFRDDVFSALQWAPSRATTEETHARFLLVLKGVSYGEFDLRIAHSTSTTSKSYKQKNAMTRLSWGAAREHIGRKDLLGRTLSLYRDKADPTVFLIEID